MNKLFTLLLGATLCPSVFAQEVTKPVVKVGNWCKYESNIHGEVTHEVTGVSPDGGFTLKVEGGRLKSVRTYNEKHHLVDSDGYKFLPMWSGKEYPIRVGENRGGGKFSYDHRTKPGVKVEAETKIDSVSFEKVSVPAGEFNALAVVTIMDYRLSTGFGSRTVQTIWYPIKGGDTNVPDEARFIRSEFRDYGSVSSAEIVELIVCGNGGGKAKDTK